MGSTKMSKIFTLSALEAEKIQKTKCVQFWWTPCIFVCGQARKAVKPVPLVLDGKDLPWVESAPHLGQVLHESGSMDQDIRTKRASFIDESTKVREDFAFASPCEILRAVQVYVGNHHGSNLWRLDSVMAEQYFSA